MKYLLVILCLLPSSISLSSECKRIKSISDEEILMYERTLQQTLWTITKNELDEIVQLSDKEFENCIINKIDLTEQLFNYFQVAQQVTLPILKKEYKEFSLLVDYIEQWITINNDLELFTLRKRYILNDLIQISLSLCGLLEEKIMIIQGHN